MDVDVNVDDTMGDVGGNGDQVRQLKRTTNH